MWRNYARFLLPDVLSAATGGESCTVPHWSNVLYKWDYLRNTGILSISQLAVSHFFFYPFLLLSMKLFLANEDIILLQLFEFCRKGCIL